MIFNVFRNARAGGQTVAMPRADASRLRNLKRRARADVGAPDAPAGRRTPNVQGNNKTYYFL